MPDLRGYGDSSTPADGERHANYSKRAMALDQVDVMRHYGFDRWFNYVRAAPGPENELKAQYDAQAAKATTDIQREYMRVYTNPAKIHGMCEDYRAGASVDLEHDAADLGTKLRCPLLTLWGAKAPMGRIYDVLDIWRERAMTVTGKAMPAGHNIQEDDPAGTLSELRAFL